MKRNVAIILPVLLTMLSLCFICTSCAGGAGAVSGTISQQGDSDESLSDDYSRLNDDDYSLYTGIWVSDENDRYDFIDIDAEGDWQLYSDGDVIDEGYLWYKPEDNITHVYSHRTSEADDGYADLDGDRLYISTLGSFSYYGQSVSEFRGIWYYDYDLSAETYIVIDGYGFWEYYRRTPGDDEPTEIDSGTFSYTLDNPDIYYANSMYDDKSYLVFNFDKGILVWGDEGAYYRMEDSQ